MADRRQEIVRGLIAFSWNIYRIVSRNGENCIISPHSISSALMLACLGCRGDTERQFSKRLDRMVRHTASWIKSWHNSWVCQRSRKAIEVNEERTEAAAATAIRSYCTRNRRPMVEKVKFICDLPFLILLVDNQSGLILFVGRYSKPWIIMLFRMLHSHRNKNTLHIRHIPAEHV